MLYSNIVYSTTNDEAHTVAPRSSIFYSWKRQWELRTTAIEKIETTEMIEKHRLETKKTKLQLHHVVRQTRVRHSSHRLE